MNSFTTQFIGLVTAVIVSRIIKKHLKVLNVEEKGRLLSSFSTYRLVNTIGILGVAVSYILALNYFPQHYSYLTWALVVIFFSVSFSVTALSYRKLQSLELPRTYIRSYLISTLIQYLGVAFIFFPILFSSRPIQERFSCPFLFAGR